MADDTVQAELERLRAENAALKGRATNRGKTPNPANFLSLLDASRQFGPSRSVLRSKIRTGELKAIRFSPGGKIYIAPDDVRRLTIAIQPEPPINQQEFRERFDQIAKRVLGDGWEAKRRLQRKTAAVL